MKRVVIRIKDKLDVNQSVKLEKDIKNKDKRIRSVLVDSKTSLISILYHKDLSIKQIEKYVEELNPSSVGVDLAKVTKKRSILPLVIMGFILLILIYFSLGVSLHLPFRNIVSKHFKLISLGIFTLIFFFYSIWTSFYQTVFLLMLPLFPFMVENLGYLTFNFCRNRFWFKR